MNLEEKENMPEMGAQTAAPVQTAVSGQTGAPERASGQTEVSGQAAAQTAAMEQTAAADQAAQQEQQAKKPQNRRPAQRKSASKEQGHALRSRLPRKLRHPAGARGRREAAAEKAPRHQDLPNRLHRQSSRQRTAAGRHQLKHPRQD